jgi:hypothetical protein
MPGVHHIAFDEAFAHWLVTSKTLPPIRFSPERVELSRRHDRRSVILGQSRDCRS